MAPSSCIDLTPAEQHQLLSIARGSIAHGLETGQPLDIDPAGLEGVLAEPHGNFVTLTRNDALRGCIGTLKGTAPLAQEIAGTAWNAAFRDPRFPPLTAGEYADIRIEISVLSQPQLLAAENRNALIKQVRPRTHGLIVEDRGHRGTLLPKVWETLPDAEQFIFNLLAKAGLPPDYWSDTIRFYSYEAFEFGEAAD